MNRRTARLIFVLFVLLAPVLSAQQTIFLVRHAEKTESTSNSADPDLSAAGRMRAKALAGVLQDAQISAIYATDYRRTQQTAAPTAESLGVNITIVPAKDIEALLEKLKTTKGNALVVGHSNSVPDVIHRLTGQSVEIGEHDFNKLFVLILDSPPRLVRLRYQ